MSITSSRKRRVQLAFISALVALLVVGGASYRSMVVSNESDRLVRRTHQALEHLQSFISSIESVESSGRGFVLTGQDPYLRTFGASVLRSEHHATALRNLTLERTQRMRLASLESIAVEKIQFTKKVISLRQTAGMPAATEAISRGLGREIMEKLLRTAEEFRAEELRMLGRLDAAANLDLRRAKAVLILATAMGLLIAAAAGWSANRDNVSRQAAEERLRVGEERFLDLANNISQLAWMADAKGWIFWYNQRWFDYSGTTLEDMAGWGWQRVHHPDHVARVVDKISRCFDSGEVWEDTFPLRGRDGSYRWFLSRAVPVRDGDGHVLRWFGTNTDITDRMELEEALFVEKERAQVSLNSIGDAVVCTDVSGSITFLNLTAERMTGWSQKEATGRPLREILRIPEVTDEEPSRGDDPLLRALQGGEAGEGLTQEIFRRADGTSFAAEYSSAPMRDSHSSLLGAVIAIRDITERRAVERLKDEFVSTVSHELRTPLTSIRGSLGLLSSGVLGPIPGKGQRMLQIAISNTDRLVRLINDILDIERIDSREIELDLSTVDALLLMNDAVDAVQAMANEAGVQLDVAHCEEQLYADRDRIMQTLTNLLSNAIKFSPAGTRVTLSGAADGEHFTIRVADQGRGIPEDKVAVIFDRFKQVDASDSRDKGGSGLGLAIARSIVNAHGGRIWTEKNGEQGSVFLFTVPLSSTPISQDTASSRAALLASDHRGDGTALVLIAEDDTDLYRVISATLRPHGIRTVQAADGKEAVESLTRFLPDLMVLDLGLPVMDGDAVVASIREHASLQNLPMLVYSAREVGAAHQRRLTLGPTAFLTKSKASLQDVESRVIDLLATSRPRAERAEVLTESA